jgi:hypothetical protein
MIGVLGLPAIVRASVPLRLWPIIRSLADDAVKCGRSQAVLKISAGARKGWGIARLTPLASALLDG